MSDDKNAKLLVVGSIAFDSVETPKGAVEKALGGSAVYASIAAGYFCEPRIVGVVGLDFGEEHLRLLHECGVDTRGIEKAQGDTFFWKGRYRENFKERDTLTTELNVFEDFDPRLPDDYRDSEYVFLGNIAPELQSRVLDQMNDTKFIGMDTMNYWIHYSLEDLLSVIKRVDILFINDEEAFELSGENSILKAAERILQLGPEHLVVKRGEYGALLFAADMQLFVPAVLLSSVVDATGAGDTFAGGFMGYIASQEVLDRNAFARGLLTATSMASFAVEDFSVNVLKGLSRVQINERIEGLEAMVKI